MSKKISWTAIPTEITATNTDIGKTYTTKLLLKEYASRGIRVGVVKPIETGVVDGYAPDGSELLALVKELNVEFENISLDNKISVVDKTGDAYKIRDLQLEVELADGKKVTTSLNPIVYSTSLNWELGEGEELPRDGSQIAILSF